VREPVWRWGLGESLINSDGIAVAAIGISLLIEGLAVLVLIRLSGRYATGEATGSACSRSRQQPAPHGAVRLDISALSPLDLSRPPV
jgi:hypothetical protein